MALNKETKKKFLGLSDPIGPFDESVIARNHIHKAAVVWMIKWSRFIGWFSAVTAFFLVILPVFSVEWLDFISKFELFFSIFMIFSEFSLFAKVIFIALVIMSLLSKWFIPLAPAITNPYTSYEGVYDLELYPKKLIEEKIFWYDIFLTIFLRIAAPYVVFGAFVYAPNVGG